MVINNAEDTPDRSPIEPEGETGVSGNTERAGAPEGFSIDQASLDALLSADAGEPGGEQALLSQAELEAIIAEKANPSEDPASPQAAEVSQFFDEATLSSLLGDDTVIGPGGEAESVELPEAVREPQEIASDEELSGESLDAAAVEALMSVASTDLDGAPADAVAGEAPDMLQPPGLETPLADGDLDQPIIQADESALVGDAAALDEPMQRGPGDEESLSPDMISALVAAAGPPSEEEPQDAAPAPETPESAGPQSREEVGAVVSRAIEERRKLAGAEAAEEERPSDAAAAPAARSRASRGLLKTVTTLAVGTVSALAVFTYLYVHQERVFDASAMEGLESSELSAAVDDAERLIGEGTYGAAVERLQRALRTGGAGADMGERADAQYLMAKAAYGGLDDDAGADEIAAASDYVNAFVDVHAHDARVVDCLRWKAALLDRQDAPVSAAALYADLLTRAEGQPELDLILFEAAEAALKAGRAAEGAAYLERLLREHSGSGKAREAKLLLGDAYARAGRVDEAAALLDSAAQARRDTRDGAEAIARLAQLEIGRGRADEAARLLQEYLAAATTVEGNDRVHLALAKAHRTAGRAAEAKAELDDIVQFFPESDVTPAVYIELSNVQEDLGQKGQAMVAARQAAQRYPGNREVLNHLATLLERREAFADAAPYRLAAYDAGKPDAGLLLAAARDFRAAGEHQKSVDEYRRLLEVFPRAPEALEGSIELCETLYEQGRVSEASERLENLALATPAGPRQLPVMIALGRMYADMDISERAVEVYKKLAAQSVDPSVLAQAAESLMSSGAWDDGLAVARRVDVDKLEPARASALLTKVGEGLLMKSPEESANVLERAYAQWPEHRTGALESALIRAWLASGNVEGAEGVVTALEAARAGEGEGHAARLVQAAMLCGNAAFERGDYARAAAMFGKVAQLPEAAPETEWAKYQQATALMRLANYSESAALFDEVAGAGGALAEDAKVKAAAARVEGRLGASLGGGQTPQRAQEAQPGGVPTVAGGGAGGAAESG